MNFLKKMAGVAGLTFALTGMAATDRIEVLDAWVRGTVSGQTATGAFMEITSPVDATLVQIISPLTSMVELHTMTMTNNLMQMREVKSIELPAGKAVRLASGGLHVMLMGLKKPLGKGDKIPLHLKVVDKSGKTHTVKLEAEVRELGAPTKH